MIVVNAAGGSRTNVAAYGQRHVNHGAGHGAAMVVSTDERRARMRGAFDTVARRLSDQETFAAMLRDAGFDDVRWGNLALGIACVPVGARAR